VGGRLFVTSERVLFQASRFDRATGGKHWEVPVTSVTEVGYVEKGGDPHAGGLRPRLGIRTPAGLEIFVVSKLESRIAELQACLGIADRSHYPARGTNDEAKRIIRGSALVVALWVLALILSLASGGEGPIRSAARVVFALSTVLGIALMIRDLGRWGRRRSED
jgi:hypothetical protein